jgi:argininosuccinate synthase
MNKSNRIFEIIQMSFEESDAEFMEDYGLVQEVTSASGNNTILPIDCYRHFITDEIIDLMVRETNRYTEQYLQTHEISR